MGTRIVHDSGTVTEIHGAALTPELEQAYKLVDLATTFERKREASERRIARLRQSADYIAKQNAKLQAAIKAHNAELVTLYVAGNLPDGYEVAYEDDGFRFAENLPVVPTGVRVPARLVAPEESQSHETVTNKFDALAASV